MIIWSVCDSLLGCSRRLPDFALGIILQKPFPARTALCRGSLAASAESFEPIFAEGAVQWVRTHEMVAQGDGHTVRSVQSPGRTFDREHAADESRDLLLGGRASARDTLFDACGGVFEYLQSAAQRRSHRHALRPAQLEHRLHVLAEEGRFEGHLAGAVFVHEGTDPLENVAQLFVRIVHPVQVDVAQHDRSDLPSANLQHPVPHVVGAGVDAHDAVCRRVGHGAGTLLLLEGRDLLFRLTHAACQVGQVLFIISNPPYGERIEEKENLPALYREIGERFAALDAWSMYLITSYEDAQKYIGRKADKNRKIYNGMLKTYFYQFMGPKPPRRSQENGSN